MAHPCIPPAKAMEEPLANLVGSFQRERTRRTTADNEALRRLSEPSLSAEMPRFPALHQAALA